MLIYQQVKFIRLIKERDNDLLINEVLERNIKEVVVNTDFDKIVLDTLKRNYNVTISLYNNKNLINDYSNVYKDIKDDRIIEGIKYLLSYLENTQKMKFITSQSNYSKKWRFFLRMNIHTKRNLELTENIRTKEKKYSTFMVTW